MDALAILHSSSLCQPAWTQSLIFSSKRKYYSFEELPEDCQETYDFTFLFNGALIRVSTLKKIGNVCRDYFLYGDEVDYFFRLREWDGTLSSAERQKT